MDVSEREPASDPPQRIAFLITRSDAIGGAQVHVLELARALQAAGHVVSVFTGTEGGANLERSFIDMLRAAAIPVWPIPELVRAIDPLIDLRAVRALRTALVAFRPNLISTHSTKAGWLGRLVGRAMGVPVVVTAHGWLIAPGKLAPWQRVAKLAEQASAPLADAIICVSEYDRKIALDHRITAPGKLWVVHNALPDRETRVADPGLEPPKLVMVARFEEPKDPLTAIAALARLRGHAWTCELIGDGPLRGQVEAAIAEHALGDRISLSGTCNDVPERLARAQVFMLITKREGFPISILEAMRAGLPVVASDVGGIREAVLEGETGALVEGGNAGSIADALERLIKNPQLRIEQGAASRKRFLTQFDFQTHLRRIWAVYARVVARG